ncbi:MAG: glycine--tRNA ligase subunit beta [Deltaproteobacteria bacterium]|nr:glycine--tRNA ligase subunit beta [Deltaproteobacteria bacterium]
MTQDLLLEIGTEEIPAGFLTKAFQDLKLEAQKMLDRLRLEHGEIRVFGTPRRLALLVAELADGQVDRVVENTGPAKSIAFDADGKPTKAGIGFARGQGVTPEELEIITTEKGEYVCVRKREQGEKTETLLSQALPAFINAIPFRKSMRWHDLDARFARPIHWIVALYGTTVIPFTFAGVTSGNRSRGHRFMAPEEFAIDNPGAYIELCRKARVVVDQNERRQMIVSQLAEIEKQLGGKVIEDPELLETVTNLVEIPQAIAGSFDQSFLELPEEVLITVMRHHQKYFCLRDGDGRLMAHFITINNTQARDPQVVVQGNQRVLLARLNDARFFYREDLKIPLEDFVERLKNVVFQAQLGTSYEKVERFRALAEKLAAELCPEKREKISRTALLCKADLESSMVCEFSDLQGIMGREYARAAGEDEELAVAIYEHYLPTGSGSALPSNDCGAIVGIADKLDTIAGCFGVGLQPTGSADPYALRRQALGIINICLDRGYRFSLGKMVDQALEQLKEKIIKPAAEIKQEILDFIKGRFFHRQTAAGIPAGVVEAVQAAGFDDIVEANRRLEALERFRHRDDFADLMTAFKRIVNITRKEKENYTLDPDRLGEKAEQELHQAAQVASARIAEALAGGDYDAALAAVAELKESVDTFFDEIMVMVDDPEIRKNRLALLQGIAADFRKIADFSKL